MLGLSMGFDCWESGKINALGNLKKDRRPDIDKIYLYLKDPFQSKYHFFLFFYFFFNGREKVKIKKLKNPKAFINYSQKIDDIFKNLGDYNPPKKSVGSV